VSEGEKMSTEKPWKGKVVQAMNIGGEVKQIYAEEESRCAGETRANEQSRIKGISPRGC
jgi:hypothetical protein